MRYPAVDRSDFVPNFDGHMGDHVFDIGWAEGVLGDGRPFRMECWGLAGSTGVTVFMASEGLTGPDAIATAEAVQALLERSGVITLLAPHDLQESSLHHFTDPSGTACLSISYVVADEWDEYFVTAHPLLTSYRGGRITGALIDLLDDALDDLPDDWLDDAELIAELDAVYDAARMRPRSPMAQARWEAKQLARLQPRQARKKRRKKRRKFRKDDTA
ncbi:hypothetical protein [Gemmatimonas sp.]|uniref:hypothetical protein n=1 Tax=Gemmatimonas sp. TaxID=1962908 RepID=UPI0025C062EC|nr:hypothetical protein [Gemmatimonas sp.]MCA2989855.1 hypothetical protein [Gemmatimonas sp.]